MTPQKLTGFHKFVSFVLIAILVILVLGFAVNGWQKDEKLPDSGDVGNRTDDTDEKDNLDGTNNENNPSNNESLNNPNPEQDNTQNNPQPPVEEPEIFINPMTGTQVSENRYNTVPTAVVVNPTAPLYGISNSDLSIEFPIEDGSSRLLVYSTSEEILWKIGALTATRSFISSMTNFFGGIVVSYGKDDIVIYDPWEENAFLLDISKYSDCYYIENTLYIYTSENMIELAKNKTQQLQSQNYYKASPYEFYDTSSFLGTGDASTVIIPFSAKNETELYYHEKSGQYLYYKSANRKMDMLTGENISFKNVFIIFADSTTYEKAEGNELVMDVLSGGKGYYISNGRYAEFTWSTDISGALSFFTLSGEKLKVNPGNNYFAYYKSSNTSMIKII